MQIVHSRPGAVFRNIEKMCFIPTRVIEDEDPRSSNIKLSNNVIMLHVTPKCHRANTICHRLTKYKRDEQRELLIHLCIYNFCV